MNQDTPQIGEVVEDSFTRELLTVLEIEETSDGRDTYVRGKFTLERDSGLQTRHIEDIAAR